MQCSVWIHVVMCLTSLPAVENPLLPTISTTTTANGVTSEIKRSEIDPYPCINSCNCFYFTNPDRVDVACKLDALDTRFVDFSPFTTTHFPSRLLIYCNDFVYVSRLEDGMFEGLHAFYYVKIKGCLITDVYRQAFRGMRSLKTLIIAGGKNTSFDSEFLQLPELSDLEIISITDTDLAVSPSMCNLDKLWFVNLSRNSIERFVNTGLVCDRPTNIISIIITDNKMYDLPATFYSVTSKLKRLSVSRNRIGAISPNIFQNLTEIEILDLNNNNIFQFPSDFLGNNTNIHTLQLGGNVVADLPEGIFSPLENLTFLNLDGMMLNYEIWRQIVNLESLQALNLNDNTYIKAFSKPALSNLKQLQILEISRNGIREIPNRTFDVQSKMTLLNMTGNVVASIDESSLKGLINLVSLDLKHNKIEYIHPHALVQLPNLQLLNLSYNCFVQLPEFPSTLIVLDLRHNEIFYIEPNAFSGLVSLQGINLMNNKITYLPRNLFLTNVNLKLLQLAFNNFTTISYHSFPINSALEVLILHHNNITDIMESFAPEYFPNLKTLDISYNKIEVLAPPMLGGLFPKHIEELFLVSNKIRMLENFIFKLPHVRVIDLRKNNISYLSNLVLEVLPGMLTPVAYFLAGNPFICDCQLDWLRRKTYTGYVIEDFDVLYCSHTYKYRNNLLKDIPAENFLCKYAENCFGQCSAACCRDDNNCPCRTFCPINCTCYRSNNWVDADIIDCAGTHLTSVPVNVSPTATIFDLSGNNFQSLITGQFDGLTRLRELSLHNCNISSVHVGAFKGLVNLTKLNLGKNFLRSLNPGMFKGLTKLKKLTLSFNKITLIVEKTFDPLVSLNDLDLSMNALKNISKFEFARMTFIASLKISGNPWSCECTYLERMKNFTIAHAQNIIDFSDVVCQRRNESSNTTEQHRLADVKLPDFCQNEALIYNQTNTDNDELGRAAIAAMIATLSVTVLGLIIFGLIFWNREFLKVWCFVKFGWKFNGGENKDEANRPYDAFVSYSNQDEEFVVRELVAYLEEGRQGRQGYRMCVHYRDFAIGASIAESILSAVEQSKRVIIILSDNFLNSEWCQYEFQAAHHQLLEEKKNRIIMILLHDINFDLEDSQLKDYIKTRTYVKYGDPWFWAKLEYAMPKTKAAVAANREFGYEGAQPDGTPNNIREQEATLGDDFLDDDMQYIIDNMRNYEADDPKIFAFQVDIEQ